LRVLGRGIEVDHKFVEVLIQYSEVLIQYSEVLMQFRGVLGSESGGNKLANQVPD